MYSYEVRLTTGWTILNDISVSGVELIRYYEDRSPRLRDKTGGNVTIYGNDYQKLHNEKQAGNIVLPFKIKFNNETLLEPFLWLYGEWSERSAICSLSIENEDDYTELLRNMDASHSFTLNGEPDQFSALIRYCNMTNQIIPYKVVQQQGNAGLLTTPYEGDNWEFCYQWIPGNASCPEFQPDYNYIAGTRVYDAGGSAILQGVLEESFYRSGNEYYVCKETHHSGSTPDSGKFYLLTELWEMGRHYSPIKFDGADGIDEDQNNAYYIAGCSTPSIEHSLTNMKCFDLFGVLQYLLSVTSSDITIKESNYFPYLAATQPNIENLYLYYNVKIDYATDKDTNTESVTISLSDVLEIYKTLFNVDWKLVNKEFIFVHPSEFVQDLPPHIVNYEYNYFDRIFSKDFSNELFTDNEANKFYQEIFTIGITSELPTDNIEQLNFGPMAIEYVNAYTEKMDYIVTSVETNLALFTRGQDSLSGACVVAVNPSGEVISTLSITLNKMIYNSELMQRNLIPKYFYDNRMFTKGTFYPLNDDNNVINPVVVDLIKTRDYSTEMKSPVYRQDLIDFSYLVKTSFGNLVPWELKIDLQSSGSNLTAGK